MHQSSILLDVFLLVNSSLLLVSAFKELGEHSDSLLYKTVWYFMLPIYIVATITGVLSMLLQEDALRFVPIRNISLLVLLYYSILFALVLTGFKKRVSLSIEKSLGTVIK